MPRITFKKFWKVVWCNLSGGHIWRAVGIIIPGNDKDSTKIYVVCDYCDASYELPTSEAIRHMLGFK